MIVKPSAETHAAATASARPGRRLLLLLIIIAELNHRLVEVLGSARVQGGGGRGSEGGALAGFERLGLLAATVRTQGHCRRDTRATMGTRQR